MVYQFSIVHIPKSVGAQHPELAYRLSNGTILFPSEQDPEGCYWGAAGLDGMYLRTGIRYCPVLNDLSQIVAFQKAMPPEGRSEEARA